jgi:predicted Zn-ribbon and HTH transcriptional regulator
MSPDVSKKYEITETRKNNLLRLRKYMNETLYDQIPPLHDLHRSIEEMNFIACANSVSSNTFLVEMIPKFTVYFKKLEYKVVAEKIKSEYFSDKTDYRKDMEHISDVFSMDNLEYFMDDPKCAECGNEATNRCSRCKCEWYCSKNCQVILIF